MGTYKLVHGNHGNEMFSTIAELWKDQKYCDCTLIVDCLRVQLHKLVILGAWPSVMTSYSVIEDNGNIEIYLPDYFNPDAVSDFVSFLYGGEIAVTQANIDTLEAIASSSSNSTLIKVCNDFRQSCLGENVQSCSGENVQSALVERKKISALINNNVVSTTMSMSPRLVIQVKKRSGPVDNASCSKLRKTNKGTKSDPESVSTPSNSFGEVSQESVPIKQEPDSESDDTHHDFDSMNISCYSSSEVSQQQEPDPNPAATDDVIMYLKSNNDSSLPLQSEESNIGINEQEENSLSQVQEETEEAGKSKKGQCIIDNLDKDSNILLALDIMDANYLCEECGKYFKNPNTLRVHRKTHTGLRPFSCDVCGKMFGRKDVLEEHLRAHKNQANYVCQECGKSFCRRFSLHVHAMSHTPDKKYACKHCTKTYLTRSNLTKHEETHKEKETCPKCNVCVMHLKEHTKTCGAAPSFMCSTCAKTFPQKRYLTQHMLTHMPSKQYECPKCHKSFKHRASLHYHKDRCTAQ